MGVGWVRWGVGEVGKVVGVWRGWGVVWDGVGGYEGGGVGPGLGGGGNGAEEEVDVEGAGEGGSVGLGWWLAGGIVWGWGFWRVCLGEGDRGGKRTCRPGC